MFIMRATIRSDAATKKTLFEMLPWRRHRALRGLSRQPPDPRHVARAGRGVVTPQKMPRGRWRRSNRAWERNAHPRKPQPESDRPAGCARSTASHLAWTNTPSRGGTASCRRDGESKRGSGRGWGGWTPWRCLSAIIWRAHAIAIIAERQRHPIALIAERQRHPGPGATMAVAILRAPRRSWPPSVAYVAKTKFLTLHVVGSIMEQ